MEMENSRRSAMDRSREPGLKKARLADETPNRERPFPHGRPSDPRLRAAEREERGDPSRGGLTSFHQQQELVAQYKTALGELTFNSKPIITNLTIIAGENNHAAKAIASTVCANILEVPSEQKLPSLYLLDSIVKNIGRDYIKYFGARLPEVFCKAFKQVDSSIHPGMRHLFGTWKGVFPPGPLQIIEKELGFTSTVNGSSGATTSRSDAQTQHQPHSIHVNPKYLEARQRLQQPPRAKETSRDDITSSIAPVANADRMTTAGSSRQWEDLTIKGIQRSQREQLSEPLLANRAYRGYEFSSNFSPQVLGSERVSETVKERAGQDKAWYGPSSTAVDASTNRRSGIDIVRGYGKYRESGTAEMAPQLPPVHMNVTSKNSKPASKSWKNSEEEEFMWENINFRSEGHEGTSGSIKSAWFVDDGDKTAGMRRGKQTPMETQHLDSRLSQFEALTQYVNRSSVEDRVLPSSKAEDQFLPARRQPDIEARVSMDTALDSLSTHRTSLGHHTSSILPPREAPSRSINLNQLSSRILSQSEGQSVSLNGQKPLELSGHLNQAHAATSPEPFQSHAISGRQQSHAKSQYLQNISESSAPSGRPRHPVQKLEPLHSDPLAQPSQSSNQMQKQPALALSLGTHQAEGLCAKSHSNNAPVEVSRQSSTSNLLAAIMKSGLLSEISASNLQNLNVQPPLPSGPPPIHAMTSAGPSVAPSSASLSTSDNNAPALAPLPVRGVLPPLPPGPPPPSSLSNTSLKSSSAAASTLNPLSSLLSSLVAKGLISSPASEQTTITSQTPNKLQNSSNSDDSTSLLTPSTRVSSEVPAPLVEEHSVHESSPPDVALSECATELNSLLGLDFKPEIIREHYPYVINSLFNDLKEQCHKCGLRFRLEEQLHSHLDWHDSQNPHKSHSEKESRKWYATVGSWITGTMGPSSGPGSLEEKVLVEEDCESMVPADECQCICALCGEPFEDFYSEKRDEWMYKGTVYLKLSDTQVDKACINESTGQAPIVHAECISRNEVRDVVTVYQNEAELS